MIWKKLLAASIFSAEEFLPFALKVGISGAFETLLCLSRTARHDIAEAHELNTTCHENLRSYMCICSLQISLKCLPSSIKDMVRLFYKLCHAGLQDADAYNLTFLFCRAYKLIKFNWSIKVC